MDLLRALVLGAVQGLTEFLPVSSSGHLILVRGLFRWPDDGLAFDVGLHMGTLLALLAYFWRDWWVMFSTGTVDTLRHRWRFSRHRDASRLIWLLALGSIPAAAGGLLFDDWIEEHVRQAWFVAVMLAGFGLLLFVADRRGSQTRRTRSVGVVDAVVVGLAQAVALLPGVSRSGITITASLFRGLERSEAARFAFLLGTPAFVGAAIVKLGDLSGASGREWAQMGFGFTASAIVGFLAIHSLLAFLRRRSLVPFVAYRLVVAAMTLLIAGFRVL